MGFLELNLHLILSSLSRNARKKLSVFLSQKELPNSGWPLRVGSEASSTNVGEVKSISPNTDPAASGINPTAAASGGTSTSQEKSIASIIKFIDSLLGVKLSDHSSSVLSLFLKNLKSRNATIGFWEKDTRTGNRRLVFLNPADMLNASIAEIKSSRKSRKGAKNSGA